MYKLTDISFDKILMDGIRDMIFVMRLVNDEDFIYEFLNRAAMEKTELNESVLGKTIHEVHSSETAKILYNHYRKTVRTQSSVTYSDAYVIENREKRYFEIRLTPLFDQTNGCTRIVAVVKDITKKVNIYKKLKESEEHFRIIAEHAGDLITLINNKGEIIYTSPSYENILGFDHKEYIGKLFLHNIHPDDRIQVNKRVVHAINNGECFTIAYRQFNNKNQSIWSESHGSPVFDKNNEFKHMVVVTRDIRKQKEYEAKLKYFALHDPLTGLPNRRLFKEHLARALTNFKEKGDGLAVIMLDIDNFKKINDKMGHDIGDEVIIEFGRRIMKSIEDNDSVARLGGDEFVVLLTGIRSKENILNTVYNIQTAIQKPWDINGQVTTSMGITMASTHNATPFSIFKNADKALYEAKNSGRNTYKFKD